MDTSAYLSMFIDESNEHLQAINDSLLELEKSPEQLELVEQIFRSAHTLKGMSATMGFEDLASLTHQMENVLDLVRNEKLQMNKRIFDALFQSLDALEAMVADIVDGGTGKADVRAIVHELGEIESGDIQKDAEQVSVANENFKLDLYQQTVVQQAAEQGYDIFLIHVIIEEQCVMKSVRAYMVVETLSQLGEIFMQEPSAEVMEKDWADHQFHVGLITQQSEDHIKTSVLNISEIADVKLSRWNEGVQEAATSTVKTEEKQEEKASEQKKANSGRMRQEAPLSRTIRVDLNRLDQVINLFSEMLIDRGRLDSLAEQLNQPELTETVEHMSRISTELQELVLRLRMMPLESVFARFPRMVRDIAGNLNKQIDFIITGQETELDRTVIEEIGDPLVHLLRNSLDHGIETREERLQAQKPEVGTIHLRAFHSGGQVTIEIEDDGKGIDRDKVLATALEKEIISAEKASSMSDEEVYQLLFASGFSTADKVSDLSGRGVGLDVVKSKINSLGGEVRVISQRGVGTKFIIQLPLTLSIITAMLFRLGTENYALPLASIVETAVYEKSAIQFVHGNRMLEYRGKLIPLMILNDILEVPATGQDEKEVSVMIIRKGDQLAAVQVDEIVGQQDIVLKSLGEYLQGTFAVSGATILGNGQVALILDVNTLIL